MDTEKRMFKRMPVEFETHCIRNLSGTSHEYFVSCAKDLSLQGVHLISSKAVGIGEHIAMALKIPAYFLPLLFYGEVVWMKSQNDTHNDQEAGVRFFKTDPVDQKRLTEYLGSIEKEYIAPTYRKDIAEEAGILQTA